jgi:hypothetical protein
MCHHVHCRRICAFSRRCCRCRRRCAPRWNSVSTDRFGPIARCCVVARCPCRLVYCRYRPRMFSSPRCGIIVVCLDLRVSHAASLAKDCGCGVLLALGFYDRVRAQGVDASAAIAALLLLLVTAVILALSSGSFVQRGAIAYSVSAVFEGAAGCCRGRCRYRLVRGRRLLCVCQSVLRSSKQCVTRARAA